MVACTPDFKNATQSARPSTTYTHVRRTPAWLTTISATKNSPPSPRLTQESSAV